MATASWRTKASQKGGSQARGFSSERSFTVAAPCREFPFSLWDTKNATGKRKPISIRQDVVEALTRCFMKLWIWMNDVDRLTEGAAMSISRDRR